ncbi:MAG: hydrolase [Sphingobacteriaceae bacterium]|jgi:lysophospholipase L1-like esterase|nr:hydrolase [Sphingobacteriaceae bacterium]
MKIINKILLLAALACADGAYAQTKQSYTPATQLTMVGKVYATKSPFHRVDTATYPDLPPVVKRLLTNSAGEAISFRTNSSTISAKWCVTALKQLSNMTPIANKGLDLYIKKDGKWVFAGVGRPGDECNTGTLVSNMDNSEKECLLYLPLYDETKKLEIGVDEKSWIKPAADPFRKRILIYGSSILQGASASRPGMAYPARLSRETGLNFLNLGISGNAKMEKAAADMVASINADAYILDCVPNPSPEQITERTAYLISAIRKNHPSAPIIMIQSIVRETGNFDPKVAKTVHQQNENFRQEYLAAVRRGTNDLYFIPAANLLGNDHEATVDGTHPNDIGFDRMLNVLKPQILSILKEYGIDAPVNY